MPTSDHLISVIMPAYNAAPYLQAAVESILKQSHQNLELIIINDASSDQTLAIAKNFQSSDPRVHVLHNERNLKIAGSLNRGLALAKGDFIARMDADDIAEPTRLERQLSFLLLNPEIDMCGARIQLIGPNTEFLQGCSVVCDHRAISRLLSFMVPIAHPTWFCRADFYRDLGGYREIAPVEDFDLLLRALEKGKVLSNIPSMELSLRISDSNTASTNSLAQRKAFNYAKLLQKQRRELGHDNFSVPEFQSVKDSSSVMKRLHSFSQKMFAHAASLKYRKNPFFPVFLMISVLSSFYQAQFVFRGLLARLYLQLKYD